MYKFIKVDKLSLIKSVHILHNILPIYDVSITSRYITSSSLSSYRRFARAEPTSQKGPRVTKQGPLGL